MPDELELEEREEAVVVHLPGAELAWFASSDRGRARLRLERRVLELLTARCAFLVPRVLFTAPDGSFDRRAKVPGRHDPFALFAVARGDGEFVARRASPAIRPSRTDMLEAALANPCGRTLAEDLAWTELALRRCGA